MKKTNDFPEWKPTKRVINIIEESINGRDKYKALRSSSSNFVSKKEVRSYIFERDNFKCVECGSTEMLTIDHINSVWSAFMGLSSIKKLNIKQNLQVLCLKCNSGKLP